jgi:hypothetical protein
MAGIVVPAIASVLETDIWLLRQLQYQVQKEASKITAVYEFELLDRNWEPPAGACWVGRVGFGKMDFLPAGLREVVLAYLGGLETARIPAKRPPWGSPGWPSEVRPWVDSHLREHGAALERMEQVKHWGISSVIRLKTDREDFYFKAPQTSQPLFANEARLTANLAELFPGWVPLPLAIDTERDWLLFHDFGDTDTWNMPLETRTDFYRTYASLQVESIGHVEELLRTGCLDRRLAVLKSQIDPLLESQQATARVSSDKRPRLRALAPVLKDLCDRLAGYDVPATLVHGDLHLGNALVNGQRFQIYDWTDACIAHPFMDLLNIREEKDPKMEKQLLQAYFEAWQDYETMPRLFEMWRLAVILGMLHQAVSYDSIVKNLEPDSKKELDVTHEYLHGVLEEVQAFQAEAGM